MKENWAIALGVLAVLGWRPAPAVGQNKIEWRVLQPGLELATIALGPSVPAGDNRLIAVRVDPRRAQLTLALASAKDKRPRVAGDWCKAAGLAVAINAGMFRDDGLTNVGHLVDGRHVNNARWVGKYQAALGLLPRDAKQPPAVMVDLDEAGAREKLAEYQTVIQNLRLIKSQKGPGHNVWPDQPKRWSEAAVAIDDHARVLFLFSRTPFSMAEFNRRVLGLPLGIQRAMHVEGGPEASLSIHAGGIDADYYGSYETGFVENDDNNRPWPIPNVLGVIRAK